MEAQQKPLELILARNLITSISTPALLLDDHARLVFFNEAAGALLGRSFEDVGRLEPEAWAQSFGPLDDGGGAIPLDDLHLTEMIRSGSPAHANMTIRSADGSEHRIAASAIPIMASDEGSGALIMFWPETNGTGAGGPQGADELESKGAV